MERLELGARLGAQLRVEVRERLVEEEHRRLAHEGARERYPLPLAARELLRAPVEELGAAGELGRRVYPARQLARRARRAP